MPSAILGRAKIAGSAFLMAKPAWIGAGVTAGSCFPGRLGEHRCRLAAIVACKSGDPQVQPLDLFDGDQVYFTQKFD